MPFGLDYDVMTVFLEKARELPSWQERTRPLDVILRPPGLLDPIGDPQATAGHLRQVFSVGGTQADLHITSTSSAHFVEQLEALANLEI